MTEKSLWWSPSDSAPRRRRGRSSTRYIIPRSRTQLPRFLRRDRHASCLTLSRCVGATVESCRAPVDSSKNLHIWYTRQISSLAGGARLGDDRLVGANG